MELSDRKKQILRIIIESYVATAEPIGSKALAEHSNLDISPATIRNEMADLTELGYLVQPHTSAGRIPSPLGYRLYVNELMEQHQLTQQDTQNINQVLNLKMEELDRIIEKAGKVLSEISDYPVFSMASPRTEPAVKRFDLLVVEENAFITVVMTHSSTVKNKLIRLNESVSESQIQLLSTLLNNSFVGLTLPLMERSLEQMSSKSPPNAFHLIANVVHFAMDVLKQEAHRPLKTAGVTQLLEFPEYNNVDKAKSLMTYLTEESEQLELPVTLEHGTNILIGPENITEALKDTSVVMASYDIGEGMKGVIGVVGPTRMDYAKVTARLSYFADSLTKMFGKQELQPSQDPQEEEKQPPTSS